MDTETQQHKRCSKCHDRKLTDEFYGNKRSPDGRQAYCKSCQLAYERVAQKRPHKIEYARNRTLGINFGITTAIYEQMRQVQGDVCAICGGVCKTGRKLAVDHHHDSGRVRGLLCGQCNTGLGNLREDPAIFAKALEYLTLTKRVDWRTGAGTPQ